MLKVLQVWADWFLFSDSYVTGLRATFLRPGNSRVPPFHTLCGDNQSLRENGCAGDAGELGGYLAEGTDATTGQDAALAMGEGAAARELLNLPLAELERRCRHNGLSIRGGTEVMVARLLSLEEAEKQKNQEQEEEIRAVQGYLKQSAAILKEASDSNARVRGEESNRGAWTELGSGWREVSRYERALQDDSENGNQNATTQFYSGYPEVEDVKVKDLNRHSGASSMSTSLPIPLPEWKAFGEKAEKVEPVLPASKWTREDGSSDDENEGDKKGLGLGYSSSGSDDLSKNVLKGEKHDHSVPDGSMDEERRCNSINACHFLFNAFSSACYVSLLI